MRFSIRSPHSEYPRVSEWMAAFDNEPVSSVRSISISSARMVTDGSTRTALPRAAADCRTWLTSISSAVKRVSPRRTSTSPLADTVLLF